MTLEIIQEAITELERLQAESTQGEWVKEPSPRFHDLYYHVKSTVEGKYGEQYPFIDSENEGFEEADVDLVTALHRTIPAVLRILQQAADEAATRIQPKAYYEDIMYSEIALARAILGETG